MLKKIRKSKAGSLTFVLASLTLMMRTTAFAQPAAPFCLVHTGGFFHVASIATTDGKTIASLSAWNSDVSDIFKKAIQLQSNGTCDFDLDQAEEAVSRIVHLSTEGRALLESLREAKQKTHGSPYPGPWTCANKLAERIEKYRSASALMRVEYNLVTGHAYDPKISGFGEITGMGTVIGCGLGLVGALASVGLAAPAAAVVCGGSFIASAGVDELQHAGSKEKANGHPKPGATESGLDLGKSIALLDAAIDQDKLVLNLIYRRSDDARIKFEQMLLDAKVPASHDNWGEVIRRKFGSCENGKVPGMMDVTLAAITGTGEGSSVEGLATPDDPRLLAIFGGSTGKSPLPADLNRTATGKGPADQLVN